MLLRIVNGELWAGTCPDDLVYVGTARMSQFTQNGNRGVYVAVESDGEAELELGMVRWEAASSFDQEPDGISSYS